MKQLTLDELKKGCAAYWKNEPRDAMYRIAIQLVEAGWGNPATVAHSDLVSYCLHGTKPLIAMAVLTLRTLSSF